MPATGMGCAEMAELMEMPFGSVDLWTLRERYIRQGIPIRDSIRYAN